MERKHIGAGKLSLELVLNIFAFSIFYGLVALALIIIGGLILSGLMPSLVENINTVITIAPAFLAIGCVINLIFSILIIRASIKATFKKKTTDVSNINKALTIVIIIFVICNSLTLMFNLNSINVDYDAKVVYYEKVHELLDTDSTETIQELTELKSEDYIYTTALSISSLIVQIVILLAYKKKMIAYCENNESTTI